MASRKWGSASDNGSHLAECARERGTEMENFISCASKEAGTEDTGTHRKEGIKV